MTTTEKLMGTWKNRFNEHKKYGRLTPLRFRHNRLPDGNSYPLWLCQCDCGEYTVTAQANLVTGRTKSCGCLKAEVSREKVLKYRELGLISINRSGEVYTFLKNNPGKYYSVIQIMTKLAISKKNTNTALKHLILGGFITRKKDPEVPRRFIYGLANN